MKQTGVYSRNSFCDYDLDHEITAAVEKQRELIAEVENVAKDDKDIKLILKAIATELIESF